MSLNSSICSFNSESQETVQPTAFNIPTQIGFRPTKISYERPQHSRKTIRRDNKNIQAISLPIFTLYNIRSFFPKSKNFAQDMEERQCDLSFVTEVWQQLENKKHMSQLEELLELKGVKYNSTPRPGARRGGGAAIAVRVNKFNLSKLNIPLPRAVEVVWGLLRPKCITGSISTIILCCFYSPPRSKKNKVLVDHMTVTLQQLLSIHPGAGVIIAGDRNSIDISTLLSMDTSLHQMVKQPTRGNNILDVVVTNLARYYDEPVIIPPINPDQPGHGVPSDHRGVFVTPNTSQGQPARRNKTKKIIRPLPESLIEVFGAKLAAQDYQALSDLSVDDMVAGYTQIINTHMVETFPEKTIIVSPEDQPWFNEKLRLMKRQRLREYNKHGQSSKYFELRKVFEELFRSERAKYLEKIQLEVSECKRGSIYPILKKLSLTLVKPAMKSSSYLSMLA